MSKHIKYLYFCLNQCSIAVKRHLNHSNSFKESILFVLAHSLRGLIHYYHGGTAAHRQTWCWSGS